jgi:hypothetical protein
MKAVVLMTETGPILIVTTFASLSDPRFIQQIESRGIRKFIAYEVPLDVAKEKYGGHYDLVISDLREVDDVRVMDIEGHRVLFSFKLKDLKEPALIHEPG